MPTTRPPLPLHIDSTMMSCFRSCPQKYYLEFVLGLRPPGLSIDLHAGACFATALEAVYRATWEKGYPDKQAMEYAHACFALAWGDYELPEYKRTAKTFDRMWEAIESYFTEYPPRIDRVQPYFAADGKATFEYTFAIPLEPACDERDVSPNGKFYGMDEHPVWPLHPSGSPFLYSGRFDMLGSLHGKPVVRDEKTTGKGIGANWAEQWDLRSQFIGYTWACQQGGIDVDTVVVRGIAIQMKEIKHAEAEKVYSNHIRARWLEQLRRDLWRLRRAYNEGYFDYNLGDACTSYGNCPFMTPCQAPDDHQASWFGSYEVRHWNPLNKNPAQEPPL